MTPLLTFISDQAAGLAIALFMVAAMVVAQRMDAHDEVDAARIVSQIDHQRAAQHVALKGTP